MSEAQAMAIEAELHDLPALERERHLPVPPAPPQPDHTLGDYLASLVAHRWERPQ